MGHGGPGAPDEEPRFTAGRRPSTQVSHEDRVTLGAFVRFLREHTVVESPGPDGVRRPLNMAELAARAGISSAAVTRIEAGEQWPEKNLSPLAEALGYDAETLLAGAKAWARYNSDVVGRRSYQSLAADWTTDARPRDGDALLLKALTEEDARPAALPGTMQPLRGSDEVAQMMLRLMAWAARSFPSHEPEPDFDEGTDGWRDPKSIIISRFTPAGVLGRSGVFVDRGHWCMRNALWRGWKIEHLRSAHAWRAQMSDPEETTGAGGPWAILGRLGFDGDYSLRFVPASSDRAARLNLVDVPHHGAVLFSVRRTPKGEDLAQGCFIPAGPATAPLRRLLRSDMLELAKDGTRVVVEQPVLGAVSLFVPVQLSLDAIESQPGDQIVIKDGLNTLFEHEELVEARLERLVGKGISDREKHVLLYAHTKRRDRFLKLLEAGKSRIADVCSRTALRNFALRGTYGVGTVDDEEPVERDDRRRLLRSVYEALDSGCYTLTIDPNEDQKGREQLFNFRCVAKASSNPVVCLEVRRNPNGPARWVEIRDTVYCQSLIPYLIDREDWRAVTRVAKKQLEYWIAQVPP